MRDGPAPIDRAMRLLGLSGITRAKGIRTTIPGKDGSRAGDLLNRDFTAPCPDHTWVMDFTYVRSWAGWVHVAFILDVYSRADPGLACTDPHTPRAGDDAIADVGDALDNAPAKTLNGLDKAQCIGTTIFNEGP